MLKSYRIGILGHPLPGNLQCNDFVGSGKGWEWWVIVERMQSLAKWLNARYNTGLWTQCKRYISNTFCVWWLRSACSLSLNGYARESGPFAVGLLPKANDIDDEILFPRDRQYTNKYIFSMCSTVGLQKWSKNKHSKGSCELTGLIKWKDYNM